MTQRYILEALQKGVIAAVAASSTPTLPVKYVGRNFTPPESGGWLEVVFIPNDITDEFWGTSKTYRGLFRLIFHWVINDSGAYSVMDLANSVSGYFAKGLTLNDTGNNVTVRITDNPNHMGVIEEAPEILVPVSVRYQFFKA